MSNTAEDAIVAYEDMLNRYIAEHGYPIPPANMTSVDRYMAMSGAELRRLTSLELDEVALDVNAAAFAVADAYNRQQAVKERCRAVLARLVGHVLDNRIFSREDKWMAAARTNDEAWAYWQKMQNCDIVCLRLQGQSMRLAEMVKILSGIKYNK